jgi:Leucine-rich repeat (LRR) protein
MVVTSGLLENGHLMPRVGDWLTLDELRARIRERKLDLADEGLTALPPEIGQLTSLFALRLDGNQLTALPPEIGQLSNLHELALDNNQLTALPPEVGELTNLRTLRLNGNQLTALPPEIGQLSNLFTLRLDGNQLIALQPEIYRIASLQTLRLDGNQLTELPPEIGQLHKLRTLWLDGNQLTELPPEIGQLRTLYELMLARNKLTALPLGIGRLVKLQELGLDGNQLTVLPPQVGELTNLRTLRLNGNQLTKLPPEIGRLVKLQELGLDGNQLTVLPPEIGRLTALRTLRLNGNQLTAMQPEISQLSNLHELALDNNQLTALPPEIGSLTALRMLQLNGNQLRVLPWQLAHLLTDGLILKLQDNPLNEPFPEFLERGAHALATYLRSLEDAAIPQYEAKLLLVGEGNVGKTSLIAALQDTPFIEGRPTTHGIEIQPLTMAHPDLDVDMTVRTWDFGGQEVYRITHQFFFSRRALYLVVWNAREGQEQNEVEGWLRRIRLRVRQDAHVLIVATHCDERRPELDYPYLERVFTGLIVGRYDVDNRSGYGITKLREGIAACSAQLPQMGQLISPRWIAARYEILDHAQTEPQISYVRFEEICLRHQLEGDEIVTLAEFMHDLGQIVYYSGDEGLRDFVILDPEWLTKAISYVLEDDSTAQSGGVLDHARLAEIWHDRKDGPSYPARYHPYFLRLMEKFDVSYRLEGDDFRSLVAQLVPYERSDLPWDTNTLMPDGIRSIALACQLSEPVPGLVAWLTVRHHRASIGKHWRTGVFLRHPISAYASDALIELQAPDQLVIEVRAPSPDLFFNVLRDSVEDLLTRRWPGLDYALFVPCPTRTVDGLRCRGQFPLKFLLGYRERGRTNAPCHECLFDWDISELLTGFAQPELPLRPELQRLQEQVTEVADGVRRLESYAAETADSIRRVLRTVGDEIPDCPRLFTVSSENPTGARIFRRLYQRQYRLILWCEHPGYWHPWMAASYPLEQSKDWFVRIAPYAIVVFKALQLVVPIAASAAGVALPERQFKEAQHELELMKTLVVDLPEWKTEDQYDLIDRESAGRLTPAEGQAARALRILLFEKDRTQAFGDLRRVQAPSGDFVWVCPDHQVDYDPGLPNIPRREP